MSNPIIQAKATGVLTSQDQSNINKTIGQANANQLAIAANESAIALRATEEDLTTLEGTVNARIITGWGIQLAPNVVQYTKSCPIASAMIIDTVAAGFGHANGVELVAGVDTDTVIQLISAVLVYDGDGTGYDDGGNVTINWSGGGAALTGLVSAADSFGAGGDKIVGFMPLATAGISLPVNTGLHLVSSAAFTAGSGAEGTAKVEITYNVITTGL